MSSQAWEGAEWPVAFVCKPAKNRFVISQTLRTTSVQALPYEAVGDTVEAAAELLDWYGLRRTSCGSCPLLVSVVNCYRLLTVNSMGYN